MLYVKNHVYCECVSEHAFVNINRTFLLAAVQVSTSLRISMAFVRYVSRSKNYEQTIVDTLYRIRSLAFRPVTTVPPEKSLGLICICHSDKRCNDIYMCILALPTMTIAYRACSMVPMYACKIVKVVVARIYFHTRDLYQYRGRT